MFAPGVHLPVHRIECLLPLAHLRLHMQSFAAEQKHSTKKRRAVPQAAAGALQQRAVQPSAHLQAHANNNSPHSFSLVPHTALIKSQCLLISSTLLQPTSTSWFPPQWFESQIRQVSGPLGLSSTRHFNDRNHTGVAITSHLHGSGERHVSLRAVAVLPCLRAGACSSDRP